MGYVLPLYRRTRPLLLNNRCCRLDSTEKPMASLGRPKTRPRFLCWSYVFSYKMVFFAPDFECCCARGRWRAEVYCTAHESLVAGVSIRSTFFFFFFLFGKTPPGDFSSHREGPFSSSCFNHVSPRPLCSPRGQNAFASGGGGHRGYCVR